MTLRGGIAQIAGVFGVWMVFVVAALCGIYRVLLQPKDATLGTSVAIREERFDVVVTDLVMPGIGGDEVARVVKSVAPESVVVLMSGHLSEESGEPSWSKWVDVVLKKPFGREDIVRALSTRIKK